MGDAGGGREETVAALVQRRRCLGLNLREVAEQMGGISFNTLSRAERGRNLTADHADQIRAWLAAHPATCCLATAAPTDGLRAAVEALADEFADAPAKGDCPDGLCGACTLGIVSQRLRAALAAHTATETP